MPVNRDTHVSVEWFTLKPVNFFEDNLAFDRVFSVKFDIKGNREIGI